MAIGKYKEWLEPDSLLKIEGWARDGLTDKQIAVNMNINVSTLYDWKKKYNEISKSLKKGKEVVDRQVENALLKKALGYEYEEVTEQYDKEGECLFKKTIIKHVQGDTTAQIFWLKNRKPDQWRDRVVINDETEALDKVNKILKGIKDAAKS